MPASAAFHFDAQASLLKKSIAASGTTTATADSVNGIESGSWTVVAAYGSLTSDWPLSSATKTSVVVTAPSGSGKSCLLEYRVNGGGPTDPRTGQPTNGELVKRAKIYIAPETIVPGETTESDSANGWAGLVNAGLTGGAASELQGDDINIKDNAGDVHITLRVASDAIQFKDFLGSMTIGWEQRASGAGKTTTIKGQKGSSGNVGGDTYIGGGDGATPGTNLAGHTFFDLGQAVSNVTARSKWYSNGSTIAEAYQSAASTFRISTPSYALNVIGGGGVTVGETASSTVVAGSAITGTCAGVIGWTGSHFTVTMTGGYTLIKGPELYLSQTTIYERDASDSLKCTVTVANAYVRNFASGVSADFQYNGTSRIKLDGTGLGFFGATPVAQQADIGLLTDNSGGTANNTVEAIADPADTPVTADALRDDLVANALPSIRNNFADLVDQVNGIRTVLRNLGLMA